MKNPVPLKSPEGDLQDQILSRKKKEFSIRKTFGVDLGIERDDEGKPILDSSGNEVARDRNVWGYEEPTEHTPKIKDSYVFPSDETIAVLMGMESRDPILIIGHTGVGKTSLLEQIAARLNYNVVKISFDAAIDRGNLIGEWVVKGKEMAFQYGVVPFAFQLPGTLIVLDEWDAQNEETAYVLQRPLQKEDRKIFLVETCELIPLHPDNIIAATANTNGQGDESGLYSQGTRIQSYAQLNRFLVSIRLDFLKPEREKELLLKEYPDLEKSEANSFVAAVNKVRDGFSNGSVSVPLSTRDLLNWCDKYLKFGDALKAARFAFLNRMSNVDSKVVEGLIQRSFEEPSAL